MIVGAGGVRKLHGLKFTFLMTSPHRVRRGGALVCDMRFDQFLIMLGLLASSLLTAPVDLENGLPLPDGDVKTFPLLIFGGFHLFVNGNAPAAGADWPYHDANANTVQLFEVTHGKKPGSLEPKTSNIEQRLRT